MSAGTFRAQVYNATAAGTPILLDTNAVSALPVSVDRAPLSAPIAAGDVIRCNYQTSVGFAAAGAGQDVVVELLVGFGTVLS